MPALRVGSKVVLRSDAINFRAIELVPKHLVGRIVYQDPKANHASVEWRWQQEAYLALGTDDLGIDYQGVWRTDLLHHPGKAQPVTPSLTYATRAQMLWRLRDIARENGGSVPMEGWERDLADKLITELDTRFWEGDLVKVGTVASDDAGIGTEIGTVEPPERVLSVHGPGETLVRVGRDGHRGGDLPRTYVALVKRGQLWALDEATCGLGLEGAGLAREGDRAHAREHARSRR